MADVKYSIEKLNKKNYVTWKFMMKTVLEREKVWDVVDNVKPEKMDDKQEALWKTKDCTARTSIVLYIQPNQLRFVKTASTAREMWLNLQTYHEKATAGNQATLLDNLCMLKLSEGGDIEQHLDEMEELFERLELAGLEFNEPLRIAMTLRSLPRSYRSFVTSLENRKPEDLTMDFVVSRLRDEFQKYESQEEDYVKQEKAMKVKTDDVKKCYFCQKPGHFRADCPEMKKWRDFKAAEEQKALWASTKASDEADSSGSSLCFVAGEGFAGAWIVDSGSSCHMTSDRKFFKEFRSEVETDVTLADGTKTKASGNGSGVIFGVDGKGKRVTITLENVLYVPALEGGLISVRKLLLKGYEVVFKANQCKILTADGAVGAVAETRGSLFVLKTMCPRAKKERCLMVGAGKQEEHKEPFGGKLIKPGGESGEDRQRLRSLSKNIGRFGSTKAHSYLIENAGQKDVVNDDHFRSVDKAQSASREEVASIPISEFGSLLLEMLADTLAAHSGLSIKIGSHSGGVLD